MKLLVTRPATQASAWVEPLRALGVDAAALPLIAIDGPADAAPVQALWRQLDQARLLMFVSPSAVEWFFKLRPPGCLWPDSTLAAAPGPGTAKSLAQAGAESGLQPGHILCPAEDAAQFDSETLWPLLQAFDWPRQAAWTISGGDRQDAKGRAWLSEQLRAAGATVTPLLTYQRQAPVWRADERQLAQSAAQHPAQHGWLFSSSEAIEHLQDTLMPGQSWQAATALATHPRIADRARLAGFGRIMAVRPTPEAVAAALRQAPSGAAHVDTMNPS